MKYAATIALLMAMGAAGCSDSEPEQTEAPEKISAEDAAAEAKRILKARPKNEESESVRQPGFFGGDSTRVRRKGDFEDLDSDQTPAPPETTTASEPVKRPPPKTLTPDERAEKQVKLAELYIANAAAATSAARRKFLNDKAAAILKEVLATHPQAPITTQARKLLAGIEAGR